MDDDIRAKILAQVDGAIQEHGFAVIVTALEYEGEDYPAAYTVGLTDKGLPEILVLSMLPHQAQMCLNHLGRQALEKGAFTTDVPVEGLFGPYLSIFRECSAERLGCAQALFVGSEVKAIQFIWPDAKNRMPWDEGSEVSSMPLEPATTGVVRDGN